MLYATLGMHSLYLAVASYGPTSTVSCTLFCLTLSAFIHVAYLRPPPGPQAGIERFSLVYFTRPGNSIILRALVDESHLISEAVSRDLEKNYETRSTALEWFSRRIKNQRIKNRKVIMHYFTLIHPSSTL